MSPEETSHHLQVFRTTRCEAAFRKLTEEHAGLVYSTALRVVQGDTALAEDVVQMVFSALAAKPEVVRDGRALAAWLHRAAVGRATDAVRRESRRRKREQLSMPMTEQANSDKESSDLWEQASAVIDEAMDRLPESERQFLVLRFWQRHDLQTIGTAFGMSDNAVQKRIARALEKLRDILTRRGVRGTSSALSTVMLGAAVSLPSPAALAGITTTSLALAKTASATTSPVTKLIAMTAKQKIAAASAAAVVAIGAPAYVQHQHVKELEAQLEALRSNGGGAAPAVQVRKLEAEVTRLLEEKRLAKSTTGIAESRAEVARLTEQVRRQEAELATREAALTAALGSRRTGAGGSTGWSAAGGGMLHSYPPANGVRPTTSNGNVQWDHKQATGAPDTAAAGDRPTAWAPLNPKSGEQWLQLGYKNAVDLKEVNIHESHSPGAVSKVAAIMPDGTEKVLWEGRSTRGENEIIESAVPIPPGTTARQIKVYVDTNRVDSWPEIDAVELVGTDGSKQWANESSASSSYSENYGPGSAALEALNDAFAVDSGAVAPGGAGRGSLTR